MIEKTLSLRIVRPFYSEEVERAIQEKKKTQDKGHISYHDVFWSDLKKQYPEIITWTEFGELLTQLQRYACESYNSAMSELYQLRIIQGEKGSVDKILSEIAYPKFYEKFKSAYIAGGMRQKVKSNYREKELRQMRISLPVARAETMPIPFWFQEGIKIENKNEDFIIRIKFPEFKRKETVDKSRPWEKFEFVGGKTREIALLLSTKIRRRRGKKKGWFVDYGTDAEIRKVLNGEYEKEWKAWIANHPEDYKKNVSKYDNAHKICWIAFVKRKENECGKRKWFVNFTIHIPPRDNPNLDKNIVGGIDIGVKSPLVCAISKSPARYTINSNDVYAHNRRMKARYRALMMKNYLKRRGHGKENKLEPITKLTEKSEAFRKKIIERWASEIKNFFLKHKVGTVQMEDLSSMVDRKDDFFNRVLRTSWPYAEMQNKIENKLKEFGIEVIKVNASLTSQICSECGAWKPNFSFSDREKLNFPDFECDKCGFKENADYNAARNLTKRDIDSIIAKAKKEKEKY